MTEWMLFGVIFVTVATVAFALLLLFWSLRRPQRRQLPPAEPEPEPHLLSTTTPTSDQAILGVPRHPTAGLRAAQKELLNELRTAGYYRPSALNQYLTLRTGLVLAALLVTAMAALLVPRSYVGTTLIGGGLVALLAYSLPRLYLANRRRRRARQIERGLPLAIDLLILCLTAGQTLLAALRQTARHLLNTSPVLAQELAIMHQQAELHSLEHAAQQWSDRVPLPEVKNLCLVLIQSERLGTDAALTLQELAANFRTNARQRAESQANQTSFWMLFPSVFCFWVASAIILIGPAYLEFFQHRQKAAQFFQQSRKNIERANTPSRRMNAAERAGGAAPAVPAAPAAPPARLAPVAPAAPQLVAPAAPAPLP